MPTDNSTPHEGHRQEKARLNGLGLFMSDEVDVARRLPCERLSKTFLTLQE